MSDLPRTYDGFEQLKIRLEDHTLWVVIDNPPLNSVTAAIHEELSRVFRVAAGDDNARVVVLTGAGDRAFSAGADLKGLLNEARNDSLWYRSMAEQREIVCSMLECDKPIIARVNGDARGVGAILALYADISVVAESATLADSHVLVGLVAGDGGSLIFPRLIGLTRAKRYLLTGDPIPAAEGVSIGLVTECVSTEKLDEATNRWINKFTNAAPLAIQGTKRALNSEIRREAQVLLDTHLGLETWSHSSEDFREAVTAFLEKRDPEFKGI